MTGGLFSVVFCWKCGVYAETLIAPTTTTTLSCCCHWTSKNAVVIFYYLITMMTSSSSPSLLCLFFCGVEELRASRRSSKRVSKRTHAPPCIQSLFYLSSSSLQLPNLFSLPICCVCVFVCAFVCLYNVRGQSRRVLFASTTPSSTRNSSACNGVKLLKFV